MALQATLIKRREDEEVFEELFDLYFHRVGSFSKQEQSPLLDALREQGLSEDELEQILAILSDEAARMDPTARMAMGLRRGHVESLIRLAGIKIDWGRLVNPLQVGFFTQQVLATQSVQSFFAQKATQGAFQRFQRLWLMVYLLVMGTAHAMLRVVRSFQKSHPESHFPRVCRFAQEPTG